MAPPIKFKEEKKNCIEKFNLIKNKDTIPAPIPQQAATANILKTAEPTMVPIPISPSVIKVPITLTNNSGADVAAAYV